MYVLNPYCASHRRLPVITPESVLSNNRFLPAMASWSSQSSYDPYDLSSDDEEYLMHRNVARMTPGQINRTAHLSTAARFYLDSPPESPKTWGQIIPNHYDYHSNPMDISSSFCIPTGGANKRKCTQITPISLMWHLIFSPSHHMVSE